MTVAEWMNHADIAYIVGSYSDELYELQRELETLSRNDVKIECYITLLNGNCDNDVLRVDPRPKFSKVKQPRRPRATCIRRTK